MSELIGVTGVTGEVGRRVAEGLERLGLPYLAVVRDPSRVPTYLDCEVEEVTDYSEPDSMASACKGIDTLFLVSFREHPERLRQHRSAVDGAVAAGVKRIVYTSFLGAAPDTAFTLGRQHYHTEEYIKSKGMAYTFLRDSLYLDYMPWIAGPDGYIRGPAGSGGMAPVARDDVGDVAVAVLADPGAHHNQAYPMTGPELYSMADIAKELSRVSGREVGYVDETMEEAWESRRRFNAPEWEVEGWITSYLAIRRGELEVVSDTVPRLTGHPAQSLPEYLAAHPESYAHLVRNNGAG